MYVRYYVIAIR